MSEPLTPAEAQAEARTATALYIFALLVVVLAVVGVLIWGLPALGILGLAATLLMFLMLGAYAAGL
ncbi:hypothetical protein E3U26_21660 (plasmid) [Paracoccus ferrooxidans]|nr:hypothetical protein E3U26_21660 [Paracoccus ferrooxidans]